MPSDWRDLCQARDLAERVAVMRKRASMIIERYFNDKARMIKEIDMACQIFGYDKADFYENLNAIMYEKKGVRIEYADSPKD